MSGPPNTEIDVDEIMQRIREEVKKRKLPKPEIFQDPEPVTSKPSPTQDNPSKKSFDDFLWKYGRRYKKIVKAVPILKDIAKRQHAGLVHRFLSSPSIPQQPPPSPFDIHGLPYYINYHGFLVQAKEKEGLKGRIKHFLFNFIRFFAWWQEQINRALYQELIAQKAKIDEGDRWVQELLHQQMSSLKEDLHERDKLVEDLSSRLVLIGQAKDELLRELGDQKNRIDETGERIESLLNQQIGHVEEELNRELTLQKEKLVRMERETPNLLSQGMNTLKLEFTEAYKNLNNMIESTKNELSGLLEVKSVIHQMAEEIRNQKLEILNQQKRLMLLLEEARKRLPKPMGPKQIKNILKEEDHLFDAMYVAFEDRFRGTREEIKERLRVYLPYVKQAKIGEEGSPILDLGCGRGEWVELLKENGYIAKGVDFNRGMVMQCQQFGLDVTESDMIEYLRNQQPDSFAVLTGFHIVEHLSFKTLISLFDETLRVLKSGGMVIFETPNPENLIVGACNFYFDPTHRNPLPPRLLNYLMVSRGFEKTEIIRLHPYEFSQEQQNPSTAVEALISLFNKEQDYSVIAYKG